MSKRRISQETFDEVVKENIEDFNMSSGDALIDAVKQFTSQGIELASIDTSGGVGRDEIMEIVSWLNSAPRDILSLSDLTSSLEVLRELCDQKNTWADRNINLLFFRGGYSSLLTMLKYETRDEGLCSIMAIMTLLSNTNVACRDSFEPGGGARVCEMLASRLNVKDEANIEILRTTLLLSRTMARTENNKTLLMRSGIGPLLLKLFTLLKDEIGVSASVWSLVLQETCLLIRTLSVHDDYRSDTSSAFDNSRFFIAANVTPILMKLAHLFLSQPSLAASALSATRQLITSDEAVEVVAQNGGMVLPLAVMSSEDPSVSLVRSVAGLVRNLCADDSRKSKYSLDGTMYSLISVLFKQKYLDDSQLVEHVLGCLAAMSLRAPDIGIRIIEAGGVDAIIKGMTRHMGKDSLMRQACLAIRNIAARNPDVRCIFLDAGVENLLRTAGTLQGSMDEAYAAMRDLGVDVTLVRLTSEGTVTCVFETFGGGLNKGFNPSFETSNDIEDRVSQEARAPYAKCDDDECSGDDHSFHQHSNH